MTEYGFTGKLTTFCQKFKEKLMPIFLKLFQKTEKGEHFQTHFMRPALF